QKIARAYTKGLADLPGLVLPKALPNRNHVYHLYPIQIGPEAAMDRAAFINGLTEAKIGSSVHFIPVHRHPFYRDTYGYRPEQFPMAEQLYRGLVSLPIYPAMTDSSVEDVIGAARSLLSSRLS